MISVAIVASAYTYQRTKRSFQANKNYITDASSMYVDKLAMQFFIYKGKKQACITMYRKCTTMRFGVPTYLKSYPFPTKTMSLYSAQSFIFGLMCWTSMLLAVHLHGLYVCTTWVAAPRQTGHCCCKRLEQGWHTQRWPQGMITTEGRLSMHTTHGLCSGLLLPLCTS